MHYHLRTLMLAMAVGPLVLAFGWTEYRRYVERHPTVPTYKGISGSTNVYNCRIGGEPTLAEIQAAHGK